jgi:hypothetical protein
MGWLLRLVVVAGGLCLWGCNAEETVAGSTTGAGGQGVGGEGMVPPCGDEPNELANNSFEIFENGAFPSWTATAVAMPSASHLDGYFSAELSAQPDQGISQTVTRTIPASSTVLACVRTQRVEGEVPPPSLVISVHYQGAPDQVGTFAPSLFDATWSKSQGNVVTTAEATGVDLTVVNDVNTMPLVFRADAAELLVTEP